MNGEIEAALAYYKRYLVEATPNAADRAAIDKTIATLDGEIKRRDLAANTKPAQKPIKPARKPVAINPTKPVESKPVESKPEAVKPPEPKPPEPVSPPENKWTHMQHDKQH